MTVKLSRNKARFLDYHKEKMRRLIFYPLSNPKSVLKMFQQPLFLPASNQKWSPTNLSKPISFVSLSKICHSLLFCSDMYTITKVRDRYFTDVIIRLIYRKMLFHIVLSVARCLHRDVISHYTLYGYRTIKLAERCNVLPPSTGL